MKSWNWKEKKKWLMGLLIILTLFRLYLGIKTPVLLRATSIHDDYLFTGYAGSLLGGKWLGSFSSFTLLKTISPAVLQAVGYALGISYPVVITVGYISAVILFTLAIYRLMGSRRFALALYVFLLYSPVMFHEDHVQNVYRGGYIVIFTLLVFASVIGQHASRYQGQPKKEFARWTVLGCISLPVFYYLKEDAVWVLPFVCVGTLVTAIHLWKDGHTWKQWKILAVFSPLLALGCVTVGYKALNYHYYGEYTVTDRSGTYYKEVLSDLIRVDDGLNDTDLNIWVSRDMIRTAAEYSETLEQLLPFVEESWDAWFGEGNEGPGDIFIWAFRDAVSAAGVYDGGGSAVNAYYKRMHVELQEAYDRGALKELQGKIYISPVAKGFTWEELASYYGKRLPEAVGILASYRENVTGTQASTGSAEGLATMSNLTGTHFRWENTDNGFYRCDEFIVGIDRWITGVYQKTGYPVFFGALLGIVLMFGTMLVRLFRKKASERETSLLLVILGMAGSGFILLVAVIWFCSFLPDRKLYEYLCAVVPLMETLEAFGLYYLCRYIRDGVRQIKKRGT